MVTRAQHEGERDDVEIIYYFGPHSKANFEVISCFAQQLEILCILKCGVNKVEPFIFG